MLNKRLLAAGNNRIITPSSIENTTFKGTPIYFGAVGPLVGNEQLNGISISPDLSRMFVSVQSDRRIRQYNFPSPPELKDPTMAHTLVYSSPYYTPNGIFVNSAGTNMYLAAFTDIMRFTMSTPWTLSSASLSQNVTAGAITESIFWRPDGLRYYVLFAANDSITQYNVPSAWSLSSAVSAGTYTGASAWDVGSNTISFSSDGTRMYVCGSTKGLSLYNLSTAWDVTTATNPQLNNNDGVFTASTNGILGPDDSSLYSNLRRYELPNKSSPSSAYQILPNDSIGIQGQAGLNFDSTGTILLTGGGPFDSSARVKKYVLSDPWRLDTATLVGQSTYGIANGFFTTSPDGQKYYFAASGSIVERTVSVPWSIDIPINYQSLFSFTGQIASNSYAGNTFSPDGTKFFACDLNTRVIYQYNLSTPWSIATMSYSGFSYSTGITTQQLRGIEFNNTGQKMYLILYGIYDATIWEYNLSTPYSIQSGVTLVTNLTTLPLSVESVPFTIKFRPDQRKLFVATNYPCVFACDVS